MPAQKYEMRRLRSGPAPSAPEPLRAREKIWCSQHNVMPFGALASVRAWDRVAILLRHLALAFLWLPILRFVDDYFSGERAAIVSHAKHCFARLVRALLGLSAIANSKLEHGSRWVIRGILFAFSAEGIHCQPSEDKILKWSGAIRGALAAGRLEPGAASKLAGALSWACTFLFRRCGRAFIRPIFAQQHGRGSCIGPVLRWALEWWL